MAIRRAPQEDHFHSLPDQDLSRGRAARDRNRRGTCRKRGFQGAATVAWSIGLALVVLAVWGGRNDGLRANEPNDEPANRKVESAGDPAQAGEPAERGDEGRPDDYPLRPRTSDEPKKKLTSAELKLLAAQGRVRKVVDQKFRRQPRAGNRFERVNPDDYFVAAKLEVPLDVGRLDVRFEILPGLEPSVQQVSEYLFTTPQRTVRDFMVVARFETLAEAEQGLAAARKQYDDAVAYQQQLIAYLQAQQRVQVSSVRRC